MASNTSICQAAGVVLAMLICAGAVAAYGAGSRLTRPAASVCGPDWARSADAHRRNLVPVAILPAGGDRWPCLLA